MSSTAKLDFFVKSVASPLHASGYEVVERKGIGHPDTLCDGLAERLSQTYSQYTKNKFGIILHHNFDKIGLLGGKSTVRFGDGRVTSPIRVLLNGRATRQFGSTKIPVLELLEEATRDFLYTELPRLDPFNDISIQDNLSTSASPGYIVSDSEPLSSRGRWFSPRSVEDVRGAHQLVSNDTSGGVGYAPLSSLEKMVVALESSLTSKQSLSLRPWVGTDVKIMAVRVDDSVSLTVCVPQIADLTESVEAYQSHVKEVRSILEQECGKWPFETSLTINTRDRLDVPEAYLTAIGSSIESGDEGMVGRGNRFTGVISSTRPYSMEGMAGKNPVYHVGKLYTVAAQIAAERIHNDTGLYCEVYIVSQGGRLLNNPWRVMVSLGGADFSETAVRGIIDDVLSSFPELTDRIISGELITIR